MARHLMIGDDTAVSYSNGVLVDNALDVQKRSASGWTSLQPGDTIADSAEIRIVQGNGTKNIVSPWFYGRDVINWSGKSYVAAAAQTSTLLPVTTAAATVGGKELDIKFVFLNGKGKQEIFSFATTIASGSVIADSGQAIIDAFNALTSVPDWLNPTATLSTATVTFTGAKRGDTAQSGNTWDYEPVVFSTHIGSNPVTTQTYTIVDNLVDATTGYGDGFAVKAFEESLMGTSHGYYNRVELPNAPTTQTATGTNYDMYSLVATKDGSSSSQINGVDNLIELNIALKAGDADSVVVENKINAYLSGLFTAVVL